MKNLRYAIAAVALLFASFITTTAQTADGIIKKHLAAIGGAANWKKINSITSKGIMVHKGVEITYTNTILNGKGERKEFTQNGKTAFEILTDKGGWAYVPQTGLKTSPEAMPEMIAKKFQIDLDIEGPLIDYKAKGNTISYIGKGEIEGIFGYKLEINYKNGMKRIMYFDTADYYHVATAILSKEGGKDQEEITAKYGDYKKLPEGIVYPMSFNIGDGPVTINSVEINKPVDEKTFDPSNR